MMNSVLVKQIESVEGFSSWRSFGAVAANLMARIEAERHQDREPQEQFVPLAWAAE